MAEFTLITGDKNYSLWPLPAWLCLKVASLEFDEFTIPYGNPDARQCLDELSPTRVDSGPQAW